MKIPKIIHFIWAGGDFPMPLRNIQVVKKWLEINTSFKIYFWTDSKSTQRFDKTIERYKTLLENNRNLVFQDICNFSTSNGIKFDNEYVRYEIDRLRPNYGASSDLLRYLILYSFCGAYFDSDVAPGKRSLETNDIFIKDFESPTVYVDNNSQNSKTIGNDAFVTTPNNPIFYKFYQTAIGYYNFDQSKLEVDAWYNKVEAIIAQKNSLPVLTYSYDKANFILECTPLKTGPFCIRRNTVDEVGELLTLKECGVNIIPMDNITAMMENEDGIPISNTQAWTNMRIQVVGESRALASLSQTIAFELKHFGILRIDDHISNLQEAAGILQEDSIQHVIRLVSGLDFDQIKSIQISFAFVKTLNFCSERNIKNKSFLFPLQKYCVEITKDPYYYEIPIKEILYKEKILNFIKTINIIGNDPEPIIENIQKTIRCFLDFSKETIYNCNILLSRNISEKRFSEAHVSFISDYYTLLDSNLIQQEEIITGFVNDFINTNPNFDINNLINLKDEISTVRDSIVKSSFKFELTLDETTIFESDYKNNMDLLHEEKPYSELDDEFDNDSKRFGI
jgi:hypothetical protein